MSEPINLVVAMDDDSGNEAIYVDGKFRKFDTTIYACDIANVAGDNVIRFSHVIVTRSGQVWPECFDELKVV